MSGIVVLALVVRLIGLGWGLPGIDARPDERITIRHALAYGGGDLNPHWFGYPSLYGYLTAACFGLLNLWWKTIGVVKNPGDFLLRYVENDTPFVLIPRLISALSGAATVVVIHRLGRRAVSERVGLSAAFILAVLFLPVRDSHFGTTDTLMTFLGTLSLLFAWKVFEEGRRRDYLVSGFLLGLAVTTKYTAAPMALSLIAAHFLGPVPHGQRRHLRWLFWGALAAAGGFILGTPYSVLAPQEFLGMFQTSRFS
ncbi:MAG: hypothetical protein NVSMB9_32160 [Isosphaeraceae bacterium]